MASTMTSNKSTEPLTPIRKDSFEADVGDNIQKDEKAQIYDVRRQIISRSLIPCIVTGLKSETKESPSLLLWDDRGLSLFDAVLDSPKYYPAAREWGLLHDAIYDIARIIPDGARVVELGAGNMKKAALLLRALHSQHKSVEYFACDVDVSALKRGVSKLRAYFADSGLSTKIHGLLGTYEDCAAWLDSEPGTTSTSLVWFGNSMANFTPQEASKYIQGFLSSGSTMIVALDGSQDQKEIADSYEGQPNRDFILNGLSHANQILGEAVFAVDDWGFLGMWNTDTYMHESFYVARQDLSVDVCGEVYHFEMGETMRSIRSGKWPRQKVMEICKDAGGRVTKCWMNQEQSYGVYLFEKS